ncbi:MAG: hydroxymethylglutaryl-CoA lyase [Flavobacteriaceae bacterium]|nr:hydroxymethylglutaryl-CoA lyase [Flavobacteriaceae bacterium]
MISITECPRDAMQGIKNLIKTADKVQYIQSLIDVNFDVLDCGSFVSPRAIPQMADTHEVLSELDLTDSHTKLSVIVANEQGAEQACAEEKVDILGFPFSVSEKFQHYNTNATRQEGLERINKIQEIVQKSGKELLIYISMGFGNPYGEDWSTQMVEEYVAEFAKMGITQIKLSDTIGAAKDNDIAALFSHLIPKYSEIIFGAHFHTVYSDWFSKINTAFENGCRNFDGAIQGYGGCPMSQSDMVGNMPTEKLITFIHQNNLESQINMSAFQLAFNKALTLFAG